MAAACRRVVVAVPGMLARRSRPSTVGVLSAKRPFPQAPRLCSCRYFSAVPGTEADTQTPAAEPPAAESPEEDTDAPSEDIAFDLSPPPGFGEEMTVEDWLRTTKLPPRTVPEDKIQWVFRMHWSPDKFRFSAHSGTVPGDHKVRLKVLFKDLDLNKAQLMRLKKLLGPRYKPGAQQFWLVSDKWHTRMDNRAYLLYLLETLLIEARQAGTYEEELGPRDRLPLEM